MVRPGRRVPVLRTRKTRKWRKNTRRPSFSRQDRLLAYILTLVPHRHVAQDILQETNLVLWRRRDEFSGFQDRETGNIEASRDL